MEDRKVVEIPKSVRDNFKLGDDVKIIKENKNETTN